MSSSKVTVSHTCPSCGKEFSVEVDAAGLSKYLGGAKIQEALPEENSFVREFIVSQLCFDCQEKVFHQPAPGHEEEWGSPLSECVDCGTPLYLRDKGICPSCGAENY